MLNTNRRNFFLYEVCMLCSVRVFFVLLMCNVWMLTLRSVMWKIWPSNQVFKMRFGLLLNVLFIPQVPVSLSNPCFFVAFVLLRFVFVFFFWGYWHSWRCMQSANAKNFIDTDHKGSANSTLGYLWKQEAPTNRGPEADFAVGREPFWLDKTAD